MTTLINTKLLAYFQPHPAVSSSGTRTFRKKDHGRCMAKKYATSFIDLFEKELSALNASERNTDGGKNYLSRRTMCHSVKEYLKEKYALSKNLPLDLQSYLDEETDFDEMMNPLSPTFSTHLIPFGGTSLKEFGNYLIQELRGKKIRLQMPAIGRNDELLIIEYIFSDLIQYLKSNHITIFNK